MSPQYKSISSELTAAYYYYIVKEPVLTGYIFLHLCVFFRLIEGGAEIEPVENGVVIAMIAENESPLSNKRLSTLANIKRSLRNQPAKSAFDGVSRRLRDRA
jgi:hypothetical protein